jgi:uncharacterized protein
MQVPHALPGAIGGDAAVSMASSIVRMHAAGKAKSWHHRLKPRRRSKALKVEMAASPPPPAAGKSCGSCTACCKIPAVDELQKPAGVYCPHCAVGQGCKIYQRRPGECRKFMCGWILNSHLGPDLKPDKCHVVLVWANESRILFAACDPDRPDAWRAPNVLGVLRQAAVKLEPGWKVAAAVGKRTWLITKDVILSDDGEAIAIDQAMASRP